MNHKKAWAAAIALIAIAVSLSVLLGPFIRDRVSMENRTAGVEKEISHVKQEVKEARESHANLVTRGELLLVMAQIKQNQEETIRRLERIEDQLQKQGRKP